MVSSARQRHSVMLLTLLEMCFDGEGRREGIVDRDSELS